MITWSMWRRGVKCVNDITETRKRRGKTIVVNRILVFVRVHRIVIGPENHFPEPDDRSS